MREICIAGKGFSYHSSPFKNSIIRRAPYKRSYIFFLDSTDDYYRYIDIASVCRYFPITQLKICKVS